MLEDLAASCLCWEATGMAFQSMKESCCPFPCNYKHDYYILYYWLNLQHTACCIFVCYFLEDGQFVDSVVFGLVELEMINLFPFTIVCIKV